MSDTLEGCYGEKTPFLSKYSKFLSADTIIHTRSSLTAFFKPIMSHRLKTQEAISDYIHTMLHIEEGTAVWIRLLSEFCVHNYEGIRMYALQQLLQIDQTALVDFNYNLQVVCLYGFFWFLWVF